MNHNIYHLGIPDGDWWDPLCGVIEADIYLCYEVSRMFDLHACPDCMAHEDFPLYLLGDVG